MPLWVIWLIASGLLLILEIFTVSFILFFPGVAAFIAFVCAIFGLSFEVQLIVFIVSTVLMIVFLKPFIIHLFKITDVPVSSKSVIGQTAVVLKTIDNLAKTGQVKLAVEIWSAISTEDTEILEIDTKVIVDSIDGDKLVVKKS